MDKLRRTVIIGHRGMLGTDFSKVLSEQEISEVIAIGRDTIDITDLEMCDSVLTKINPQFIINCAAYTAVDDAEENQDQAYAVNAEGPKNLAIVAKKIDATLVHISTDYVFSGSEKFYIESSQPEPISVYGKTKLLGEENVKKYCNKFYIFRVAWLFGTSGKNFVSTMLNIAKKNKSINVVNDQIGSPTYTLHAVSQICKIIKAELPYGIYHVTNSGNCSWYDFAQEIFKKAQVDVELNPISTDQYPTKTKRPKYSVLLSEKTKLSNIEDLPHWKKALEDYFYRVNL